MHKKELIDIEMKKREEIVSTFDKNYLLEAGAGAGKTTIIVQRIINHIITEDINPANLVAITFTKAASTELAERIQKKALEYLKVVKDEEIIERLKDVDKIFTGTIHSFCELILREMPFDANITPNYEIIEDDIEFHNNIWNSFLRDKQKEYKKEIDILKILNIDYRELRTKAILALENPDVEFIGYDGGDYTFTGIKKEFEGVLEKYGYLSEEPFKNNSNLAKFFRALLLEKPNFEDSMDYILKECPKGGQTLDETFEKLIAKKYLDYEYSQEYKDLIGDIYSIYNKLNNLTYNTCTDFINMVVKYKKENYKGKLTFNELLYRASSLIKESPIARTHFKNKYKYFYIDEFQDTDPMQAELILHLTDQDGDYTGIKYWKNCRPMDGSLFVVGDPKQSIYRFRRADISIYNRVKGIIQNNGEVVYLDINFRSSDDICNWVESTFKKSERDNFGFFEESTDIQAGFKTILSLWDDTLDENQEEFIRGLYKYNYPEKNDEEYVANIVEDILSNYYITEKIRKSREEISEGEKDYYNIKRSVNYGDIMILTKANAETGLYLRALKARGISALLAGEKQLGDTREVLNLFILIDGLIDFRDDVKLVSVLRNCFYLDLDTIDLFLEDNKTISKYMFFKKDIEKIQHQSVKKAFSSLNEIVELSKEYSPLAFLEKIIENQVGIYNIHREYGALELRDAKSALAQTVEMLKWKDCGSLYEIREELKKLVFATVNYELPINKEEAENAVRIMNIHKAKGLEANIVFLVGGLKDRNTFGDSHYVEKDEEGNSIGYMVYKSDHLTIGPDENLKKEREKEFKEAEIDRLLYVAATRAKSALIVADGEGKNLFLNPLAKNISREIKTKREIPIKNKNKDSYSEKLKELEITKDLRKKKEISNPSYIMMTPSSFQEGIYYSSYNNWQEDIKYRSPIVKKMEIISTYSRNSPRAYKGPRGNVYGTIVHRAFEVLINKSDGLKNTNDEITQYATKIAIDETMENLELNKTNISLLYSPLKSKINHIIEIGNENGRETIKRRLKLYVKKVLNNFINNDKIRELFISSNRVFTELPFTIGIDKEREELLDRLSNYIPWDIIKQVKREEKKILVNGVVDLVIQSKDGSWTILDYKTDLSYKDDLATKLGNLYSAQLEGYKILLEEILKDEEIKIDNLYLYSTFQDGLVSIN